MFRLTSHITIGQYTFKPHEVKIQKSLFEYVDKCTIKVPITARIVRAGDMVTQTAETAQYFSEGDPVMVQLGYDGTLTTEFIGFVSRVNFTTPLEVDCEGYSYELRKKQFSGTLTNIQLIDIMRKLIEGTDITLDDNIPAFKIDKLAIDGKSGTDVLEAIKTASQNLIQFFFRGTVLWGGLVFTHPKNTVKFRMGWNVIKDGNLKLRQAKNDNYLIKWTGEAKSGLKATASSGTGGTVKHHTTHAITDQATLQALTDAQHQKLSYDGYEGKITAFGIPYTQPGDKAALEDTKYQERSGDYIVQSTEVMYGMRGYRRIIGIGEKL